MEVNRHEEHRQTYAKTKTTWSSFAANFGFLQSHLDEGSQTLGTFLYSQEEPAWDFPWYTW